MITLSFMNTTNNSMEIIKMFESGSELEASSCLAIFIVPATNGTEVEENINTLTHL